jgi:hypothetical protein
MLGGSVEQITLLSKGFDQVATRLGRQRLRPRGRIDESWNSDNRDGILRAVADDGVGPDILRKAAVRVAASSVILPSCWKATLSGGSLQSLGGTEAMPRE